MPTQCETNGLMAVAMPFQPAVPREERRFTLKAVPPLLDAITKLKPAESPHRIISYVTEDGLQFNCAFFDDSASFGAYRSWFTQSALRPEGWLHSAYAARFHDPSEMPPSAEGWLWGVGHTVLSDTREGEYTLGHGHRYSRMLFRDEAAKRDAEQAATDPQFEGRISDMMREHGVAYHGRLVMSAFEGEGWFTKSRYGSLLDAQRGTWLISEILFKEEMARWFSSYETVTGSVASTHLVNPKFPPGW